MATSEAMRVDQGGDAAVAVEKPQTDHREYRPFTLDNKMRALVISDCKCDKAAAALSVKTGSIFDPKEVQGLAHFLEHMLFLGTEKYPGEDEYNAFLAKHGGMSNAYTADCLTNYYFAVSPAQLEGALDRFSQFFVCPLFTESATDRELQAVDSEHSKNRQSDMWRWRQLMNNDANPKHPMCHFGTGNIETLKTQPEKDGLPVRQRLLEFHDKYYSANLMCVVVLGKESLDDLEALVKRLFAPVVNKDVTVPSGPAIGGEEPAFSLAATGDEAWPRFVRVVPVRDVRSLTFQFVLPQQSPARWRTKPHQYLSFMVGHEGKGSLLSALKARGLATDLSAGPSMDECGACIFEVGIELTEKGESEILAVGEHLFAYMCLLQQLPVSEELFKETQCIREMSFKFANLANPVSAASGLARAMQDGLPIDKVMSGPAKLWDMDKEQIAEVASYFKCANLRLQFAAKSNGEGDLCTETEHWYGTKFSRGQLPREWHDAWEAKRNSASGADAAKQAAAELGLEMPQPNPFVAEELDLKPRPPGGIPEYPERVIEDNGAQVYFRQDDKFDLPKALFNVELYCPWVSESWENRMVTLYWSSAVAEELNEYSYDAEIAGLHYGLNGHSRGLSLSMGGYQHKLPVLLRTIVEKMAGFEEMSEHTFSIIHTVMLRSFRSAAKTKQPHSQAAEIESRLLQRNATTSVELLAIAEAMDRSKFVGVHKKLLGNCYAEALLQGNYEQSEVSNVVQALQPALGMSASSTVSTVPGLATAPLPGGPKSCVVVRRDGTNSEEQNGAVLLTLQAASETLETVTLCELAGQVLSQRCFDELRTKQQLGYIVQLAPFANKLGVGFCGLKVIVQSEKHPAEVHRRIEAWLGPQLEKLADPSEFSDESLGEYVEALLTRKREQPKRLAEEFTRNWMEVSARTFRFTRREESIAYLERPRADLLSEFRAFITEKLLLAPRLAVEILGAAAKSASVGEDGTPNAEAAPYECDAGIERLESFADIDAFRTRLTWQESNTKIGRSGGVPS